MTSEAELQNMIAKEEAAHSERIARAVGRGGLPTEDEAGNLYTALEEVFNQLEAISWRVNGIASSDDGSELDAVISLEEIGVIAVMVSDTNSRAKEFLDFANELHGSVTHLDTIRHNQLSRASDA